MMKKKLFGVGKQTGGIVAGATVNLDAGNASSYSGSGTDWFDLTTNNNDATLVNGVGYDSGNGGVLTFDGTNDYVNGNSTPSVLASTPFTIECWFYLQGTPNFDTLFTVKMPSTASLSCQIPSSGFFLTYGSLTFGSRYMSIVQGFKITDTINTDTWYQLVITNNGTINITSSNWKCYLNSTSKVFGFSNAYGNTSNFNQIGAVNSSNSWFEGKIPIFNFYNNKEFNQTEVTQNFDFYKGRFGL